MPGGPDVATADTDLRDSNVIAAKTTGYGVWVRHNNSQPINIFGNFIGTNPERTQAFSGGTGIYCSGSNARVTKIGGSGTGEAGNVIANMTSRGVHVATGAAFVDIRSNSFSMNGASASLRDDAVYLAAGANDWPTTGTSIARPNIIAAGTFTVTVSGVQNGDVVEVFISDYDGTGTEYGEGMTIIGTLTSTGTSVDVPVDGLSAGQWVTATRTSFYNTSGDTSPFSANVQIQ